MKKVSAIVFSDLHINQWAKFNQDNIRTLNHFKVLSLVKELCNKYKCPGIFCGDLFHKPELITNDLFEIIIREFNKLNDGSWNLFCISGNHDMSKTNSIGNKSSSWISSFSKIYKFITCIDFRAAEFGDIIIHGIPYLDHNIGLTKWVKEIPIVNDKKNILLIHTDYPGAKDTDDVEVGSVENININSFFKFDLVLCGHIHKPQRLSKKEYMVGAPLQQRRTDKNCELGYWKLYSDLSMEFIPFTEFPKFIDVSSEEYVKDDGNYYTIINKPIIDDKETKEHNITLDLSNKKLVSGYFKAKGIKDRNRKKLLVDLINECDDRIH